MNKPEDKYTPAELEQIRGNWRGKKPPEMCKGNCNVKDLCLTGYACSGCGWFEDMGRDNKIKQDADQL